MNIKYNQHAPNVSHQMRKRVWRVDYLCDHHTWHERDFISKRDALRLHRRAILRGQPVYVVHGGKLLHRLNVRR